MKTTIFAFLFCGLWFMSPAYSENNTPGKETSLSSRIRSEISYPAAAFDRNIEGLVLVSFSVDSLGNLHLTGVNASHPELSDYVVRTIENIRVLPSDNAVGKSFNMKFVFRLL